MIHVQKTNNTVEVIADKLNLIPGEAIPPGAEKPRGLFSFGGAPSTPFAAEKPGGFFSTTPPGDAMKRWEKDVRRPIWDWPRHPQGPPKWRAGRLG